MDRHVVRIRQSWHIKWTLYTACNFLTQSTAIKLREVESETQQKRLTQTEAGSERKREFISPCVSHTTPTRCDEANKHILLGRTLFARLTFHSPEKWPKNNGSQSQPSHHAGGWQRTEIILLVLLYREELWYSYKNRVGIKYIYIKSKISNLGPNTSVILNRKKHQKIEWNHCKFTEHHRESLKEHPHIFHCVCPLLCTGLSLTLSPGFMNL